MTSNPPKTDDLGAWTERVLATDLAEIRAAERDVLTRLRELAYDDDHLFAVRLAFEEALVNAMKHGNQLDPSRSVRIAYRISPERVEIRVADEGTGFNPGVVPDPTSDENLEKPCGRGIMLMRCYMDKVEFSPQGNEVFMVKNRQP
ncbi:MAG TPA: ATP-binding protein [Phycisphaerae bacterium]|nr:ATP-binding protein [Phycisphaerae bacterium]